MECLADFYAKIAELPSSNVWMGSGRWEAQQCCTAVGLAKKITMQWKWWFEGPNLKFVDDVMQSIARSWNEDTDKDHDWVFVS